MFMDSTIAGQKKMDFRVLSEDDIGRIHESTLDVLEKVGIWIHDCPEAASIFSRHGCILNGDNVRIPKQAAKEWLSKVPDRSKLKLCANMLGFSEQVGLDKGQTHVGLIGNSYYLYDFEKGKRDLQEEDLHDKDLMLDHLVNFKFDCNTMLTESLRQNKPGYSYNSIDDCIDFLKIRLKNRTGAKGKKLPLHVIINDWPNERTREMAFRNVKNLERIEVLRHMIVNGPRETEDLISKDTPLIWCNPVSPLQFHPVQLREIMQGIKDYGEKCFIMFSPEVMSGATGPVTIAGTLIQHNAEVLAGTIFSQMCRPETAVIYGSVTGVMDMRMADISLGSFESMAISSAIVQLADFYGLPNRIQIGNTSANKPGVRAAVETAIGLQTGFAAGANLMTTGLLDSTLMLSYEHLALIDEIVNQLGSIRSIDTDRLPLDKEIIFQEGHPNPNYLSNEHTLEFMKQSVYYSNYTGRVNSSYEDWYELAHEKVKTVLSRKSTDEAFDKIIAGRAEAVEARLREDNETWHKGAGEWWKYYVQDIY